MSCFVYQRFSPRRQQGAVLIVSLVFMLLLTIVSVASMKSATLQERMAGNSKDINLAFQAAEAALRDGESLLAQVSVGPFDGSNGLYLSCPDPSDSKQACQEPDWEEANSSGWKIVTAGTVSDVSRQPEYIIEEMVSVSGASEALDSDLPVVSEGYYRITARGYGASDRSMVVLSTTYKRDGG